MLKFQRDYEEKSVNNNLLLSVMKYQILIQIYIIKIQTILNGRTVKESYWIKRYRILIARKIFCDLKK